jgi:uncharacterized membrane protein
VGPSEKCPLRPRRGRVGQATAWTARWSGARIPPPWAPAGDLERTTLAISRDSVAPALFGVGVAGTLDEVVLHQLLHWHHFYDRSTSAVGLVSDGLFHVFSTLMLLVGGRALLEARRRVPPFPAKRLVGGVLVGAGGFNLYDGTVQHKVLRLHQVRYGVDSLPYDVAFIGAAAVMLLAGLVIAGLPVTKRPGAGAR